MSENLNFKFTADISSFQSAIATVQSGLKATGEKMKDIGGQLSTYISLPLAALGTAAIKAFGDIQSLKNGLTAVTGSASLAEKQFIRLKDIARLPGLGLEEAVAGSINLQVIGFSAEKAEKAMKAFGNAVATVGKGKEDFKGALYGLQQLANTDLPLAEDLNIIKERIPQVTPLLKEAFGTARSDELAKMGITSAQLVDTIIDGLAKLPPVTGGINAAFENLGDGIKNNLADVGQVINNAFDISGIIDSVVESITELVTYFKDLSPEIKKTIVIFGGLGVAIPPLLVALGVFVGTILPALIAGFAALLSPVGLVVVAIAGAAVLIVENWDSVVAYFKSGEGAEIWQGIKDGAIELFNSLKTIFISIKDFVKTVWNLIGTDVIAIITTAFGEIKSIIVNVLDGISAIVKVFTSIFKGDWAGLGEGLASLTHAIWNGVVDIIKNALKITANLLGAFFKIIGMTQLGDALSATSKGYDKMFDSIKFGADKASKAIKSLKKEDVSNEEVSPKTTAKSVTKKSKDETKIDDVYSNLEIGLKQVDVSFQTTFDERALERIGEYQQAINGLIKNGVSPLSDAVKELQEQQQRHVQLPQLKNAPSVASAAPETRNSKGTIGVKFDGTRAKDAFKEITDEQRKIFRETQKFNEEFNSMVTSGLGTGIADAFNSIGEAFASGGNAMQSFGESIIKSFAGFLSSFGDLLIKYGIAAVIKGKLDIAAALPVVGIGAGIAAIAAGAALKLAAGAFSGLMGTGSKGSSSKASKENQTAFANGGIVSGRLTNAMVGEYPSAGRGNPEIIAPLNKLKSLIGDTGGMSGDVIFTVQGDKLVGVLNNYNKRQYRAS